VLICKSLKIIYLRLIMKKLFFSSIIIAAFSFILCTPEAHAKEYQKRYHNNHHQTHKKYKSKSSKSFFNFNLNLGGPAFVEREVVYPYATQVYYTQPVVAQRVVPVVPVVMETPMPVPVTSVPGRVVYEQRVYYPAYRSYSYWGY
jgi:hypothetical protein